MQLLFTYCVLRVWVYFAQLLKTKNQEMNVLPFTIIGAIKYFMIHSYRGVVLPGFSLNVDMLEQIALGHGLTLYINAQYLDHAVLYDIYELVPAFRYQPHL